MRKASHRQSAGSKHSDVPCGAMWETTKAASFDASFNLKVGAPGCSQGYETMTKAEAYTSLKPIQHVVVLTELWEDQVPRCSLSVHAENGPDEQYAMPRPGENLMIAFSTRGLVSVATLLARALGRKRGGAGISLLAIWAVGLYMLPTASAQCAAGPLSADCGPFIAEVRGLATFHHPAAAPPSPHHLPAGHGARVGHPTRPETAAHHAICHATVLTARILPARRHRRLRARRTTISTWCVTHDRLPIHRAEPK
eukprot:COSAG06_NODE_6117_length_3101_cov_17.451033_2_plen_254_part_00